MNFNLRKKAAAGITAAMTGLLVFGGAVAALPTYAENSYTPATSTSATNPSFQKYLIMRAGDTVPGVTFSYTVAAGNARSIDTGDNTVMEVRAGISPGSISVTDAVFSSSVSTATSSIPSQIDLRRTDRANISFDTASGEKFAVVSPVIDFSGVNFLEPGIYRYIISETLSAADQARGIIADEDPDRILDVYVVDDESGNLSIASYVLHQNDSDVSINSNTMGSADVATNGAAVSDKTDGFTSEYVSTDLVFLNKVTGNQASRDKYFHFYLELSDLPAGEQYAVSISQDDNANTTDGNATRLISRNPNSATTVIGSSVTQPAALTVEADGTITQSFYLQDGQSIAVRGLPINAKYSIIEDSEDYKSIPAAVEEYMDPITSGESTISVMDDNSDHVVKTSFLNQRSGAIPTGIMLSVAPGVLVLIAGAGGIAVSKGRIHRKRRFDETDDGSETENEEV